MQKEGKQSLIIAAKLQSILNSHYLLVSFYLHIGEGKTHFVHKQKQELDVEKLLTVAVDESFSALQAIRQLRMLYHHDLRKRTIGIHFKFTLFNLKVLSVDQI